MSNLLIKNAKFVLTVDDDFTTLLNQDIFIEGNKIEQIKNHDPKSSAEQIIDATNHLVMPGLVNTHTHLPMTLLRGVAEDVDLQGFLEKVWAEEARLMDQVGARIGARLGALEALLSGTTSAVDMYLHPKATHQGAVELGLRHITGPVFFDFAGPDHKTWGTRLTEALNWSNDLKEIGGPKVPVFLMPHSTYTVSPEKLTEVANLAKQMNAKVHTHVSENLAENQDVLNRYRKTPTHLLAESGNLTNAILAHSVHLSDQDYKLIDSHKAILAHCPGSNLKLASGAFDFSTAKAHQIKVTLGTDGCSSNNDLDMFNAMRLAANLAKLTQKDPKAVSVKEIIYAATRAGAQAIGMGDELGQVAVGHLADLILLDLNAAHLTPQRDLAALVVYAAGRSDVKHVIVDGELVIKDRKSTKVQMQEVIDAANEKVNQ